MDVISGFIRAINDGDVDKILYFMTEDHIFIDSQNNKLMGKENLKMGWAGYFGLFPDYKIEVTELIAKGNILALFGFASGTYKNIVNSENSNFWKIPAAWRAELEGDKIKVWQVYADNSLPIEIMKRN